MIENIEHQIHHGNIKIGSCKHTFIRSMQVDKLLKMIVNHSIRSEPVVKMRRKQYGMKKGNRENPVIFKHNSGKHIRIKMNMLEFAVWGIIQIKGMYHIRQDHNKITFRAMKGLRLNIHIAFSGKYPIDLNVRMHMSNKVITCFSIFDNRSG